MEDFAEWFCLNGRQNFTIDPQVNRDDAQYYFGRNDIKERLEKQIRKSFIAPGVPKMMVWGPYGSGKTQTLFYLEHFLRTHTPNSARGEPHTLYLDIEMRSNTTAAQFHMQLLETLGKDTVASWVRKLFNATPDFEGTLQRLCGDPNIYLILKELRATGDSTFTAWQWLSGKSLSSKDLAGLQLTRNLGDVGSSDLVKALVAVGNLAKQVGILLIFLIDEMEQAHNVRTGDAAESIHQYLLELAEPTNASVGYLIGFKADTMDEAPEMLIRADVRSRIGMASYVDIPPLPAVSDVKTFVRDLLKNLTFQAGVQDKIDTQGLDSEVGMFPFSSPAFELLADYATQDNTRSLPRYIINAINECAIQAWDEEKQLVDEEIVNSVAPLVFA